VKFIKNRKYSTLQESCGRDHILVFTLYHSLRYITVYSAFPHSVLHLSVLRFSSFDSSRAFSAPRYGPHWPLWPTPHRRSTVSTP